METTYITELLGKTAVVVKHEVQKIWQIRTMLQDVVVGVRDPQKDKAKEIRPLLFWIWRKVWNYIPRQHWAAYISSVASPGRFYYIRQELWRDTIKCRMKDIKTAD